MRTKTHFWPSIAALVTQVTPVAAAQTATRRPVHPAMKVLTEETWSLQNAAVACFVVLWFIGWNVAAKNLLVRGSQTKRDMVNTAVEAIKEDIAAAQVKKGGHDKKKHV